MVIIYIHQYFNTPDMGGSTRSYEMARRLVQRGHEVHMITSARDGSAPGFNGSNKWYVTREAGIVVHWCPVAYSNRMPYGRRIASFMRFAGKAAMRAASIRHADLVFATSTPLTVAVPGILAARRLGVPMIFEVRDLWPEIPIAVGAIRNPAAVWAARCLERWAYRYAARTVALSPAMADGVQKAGCRPDKIAFVPNGCDLELFSLPCECGEDFRKQFDWLGDRPFVVYAGTIGKINGVEYMARMADAFRDILPEARFVTVGDGAQKEAVASEAKRLGVLNENFFMLPPRPKKEIPEILCAADAALSLFIDLPQMQANSANKFFDALASGTPVAVNYGGWQAEMIKKTGAGIVLSRDVRESAQWLGDLLQDRARLQKASCCARTVARGMVSRDRLAEKLESICREVVRESGCKTRISGFRPTPEMKKRYLSVK